MCLIYQIRANSRQTIAIYVSFNLILIKFKSPKLIQFKNPQNQPIRILNFRSNKLKIPSFFSLNKLNQNPFQETKNIYKKIKSLMDDSPKKW